MISYRLATQTDAASVRTLLGQLDRSFPIPLSAKTDLDILTHKLLERGCVCLAEEEGILVGLIGFYANDPVSRTAYISVVGVLETHWRRGIARELLYRAAEISRESGMQTCVLYTHKTNCGAIAMYERMGFCGAEAPDRPHDLKFTKKL